MPYMCNIQMPMGKPKELIEKTMVEVSEVLIRNFDELPQNRYIIGGVMASEMPEFNGESEKKDEN